MSETKTPMTDALLLEINEGRTYEAAGPMADFSRRLEIMCAELEEALELSERWNRTKGDTPRKLDAALSWRENDILVEDKAKQAMANYAKMKEELKV